jgi:ferredoxin
MRVVVDYSRCDSHAVCMGLAPDVFEVGDEDDLLHLLQEHPPEAAREKVREAVRRCPKLALSVHDDE